ncbi:MAG: hypothetical protein J7K87_03020, partial [Candidatus Aenigmarchaeota archaeon]|nr:hypothetical protein [Candidatus Aenigmarchaeota archaeon]
YTIYVNINQSKKKTMNYYLRAVNPIHGQPAGNDAKSINFEPPTSPEYWTCTAWVQGSPDDIGMTPLGYLNQFNISSWYKLSKDGKVGIQRYVTYDYTAFDFYDSVPAVSEYTWIEVNFTNLDSEKWAMDYAIDWYWLGIKLTGGPSSFPYWYTNQTNPSYVNISYVYSDTPEIKYLSDYDNNFILSATSSSSINNATIYLEGEDTVNLTVQMPNTTLSYRAKYDGVSCGSTNNCNLTYQSNGEINFTLKLGSEHLLEIEGYVTAGGDVTEPIWNYTSGYLGSNTTVPSPGESVLLYSIWKDDTALDYTWLATNETGSWENKTVYSSPMKMTENNQWQWANFTWDNDSISSGVVCWRVYANDTSGNENVTTPDQCFTVSVCSVSMGFSLALAQGIDLGTLSPTNDIQASPGNNGTGITNYSIQVHVSGCTPNTVNLWTRVNQSLNTSDNSQSIPYDHYFFRYNTTNSTVPGSSHTSYSLSYQQIGINLQDGDRSYLKFFINVSTGAGPGSYKSYTFFKVNVTG